MFEDPIKTFEIFDPKEVPKILKDISKLNLYAIVIISYEASLAFDESNIVNENNKFPLLTVGLFKDPKVSNVLPELTESTELNFQIDLKLISFIKKNKEKLYLVAKERINYEIKKIVNGENAINAVILIKKLNIFGSDNLYKDSF